jgi:DNA-binding XRE family transcriptional regulator
LNNVLSHHPNMTSTALPSRNPSPREVREVRELAGLTQTQAGALVHTTCRTWQQWEAEQGTKYHRAMHPAFWELFCRKIAVATPYPSAKGSDMTPQQATARRAAVATPTPLSPEQRVLYAAAMADTEAVFALEDMSPSPQDKAITAAIVAGLVAPEQAREELHAYVLEHKTVRGFIESRPWAVR